MPQPVSFLSVLTGSFAKPAGENPTVAMVEAAYRHHGLDARYLNCEVEPEALGDAVRGARAMGWVGFSCSIPHKVTVIEHLDGLADSAAVIGAVNCVVRRDGRYIGENTDGQGFLTALRAVVDPTGKSVVVLGAGGASRAIAAEAALAGAAAITIVNRDPTRGSDPKITRLDVDNLDIQPTLHQSDVVLACVHSGPSWVAQRAQDLWSSDLSLLPHDFT